MAQERRQMDAGVDGNRRLKVLIAAATVTTSWVAFSTSHNGDTYQIWKLTSRRVYCRKDRRRTPLYASPEDPRIGWVAGPGLHWPLVLVEKLPRTSLLAVGHRGLSIPIIPCGGMDMKPILR